MSESELVQTTRVHKVSGKAETLRTSIPLELAEKLKIKEGDSIIWTEIAYGGKVGLFVRKVE